MDKEAQCKLCGREIELPKTDNNYLLSPTKEEHRLLHKWEAKRIEEANNAN